MELDQDVARCMQAMVVPVVAELTVEAVRRLERERASQMVVLPVESVETIRMGPDDATVGGRLYRPVHQADWVIVYFHSGGWVTGDVETSDATARQLAVESGADVVSVDYRLAPEHRFPAAVDDADAALDWVAAFAGSRPIAVAGDGSGGNLAAVCGQGNRALRGRISGQLLWYPVVDSDLERASYRTVPASFPLGGGMMGWYWDQYAPDRSGRRDPRASPLRSGQLEAAVPAVIVLAAEDPLVDEGRAYADALRSAGVDVTVLEYPGTVHGFLGLPGKVAIRDRAFRESCDALRRMVL